MGLREQAEADLAFIMEDRQTGFGWDIVLTSPSLVLYPQFTGFSTDISQAIDPETGLLISGRTASVALRLSSLYLRGIVQLPQAIPDKNSKPWVVEFLDINGKPYKFCVIESRPDRALGVLVLMLGAYE